jgi:hypothetical protein
MKLDKKDSDPQWVNNPGNVPEKYSCRVMGEAKNSFLRCQIGVLRRRPAIMGSSNDVFTLIAWGENWEAASKMLKL